MNIVKTESFKKDFDNLPDEIKKKARKKLAFFAIDTTHPSLQTHIIRGTKNPKRFEGYIDMSYRFTFHYGDDVVYLR